MIIPDSGWGVGGGDHSPLGFFLQYFTPSCLALGIPKTNFVMFSLLTPYFIQNFTYFCLYISLLTSNLLKLNMLAICVVFLKFYPKIYKKLLIKKLHEKNKPSLSQF